MVNAAMPPFKTPAVAIVFAGLCANAPLAAEPGGVPIAPTAETEIVMWRWTSRKPAVGWEKSAFDDSNWRKSRGGFGSPDTPGSRVGTAWTSDDIWLRREIELTPEDLAGPLQLRIHHDNDVEVYVNGVPAFQKDGHRTDYGQVDLSADARAALRPGANVLAIHCRQTGGGQFVDAGLARPAVE